MNLLQHSSRDGFLRLEGVVHMQDVVLIADCWLVVIIDWRRRIGWQAEPELAKFRGASVALLFLHHA